MALNVGEHVIEPTCGHQCIGIQQNHVLVGARRSERLIHVPGETTIARVVSRLNRVVAQRVIIKQRRDARIGRCVVDDERAKFGVDA